VEDMNDTHTHTHTHITYYTYIYVYVCVKVEDMNDIQREIEVMSMLDHPYATEGSEP
tara:strand:+ start:199 stop:369 length:171 start_codon:yes stop_codon:yes gene_type:complete